MVDFPGVKTTALALLPGSSPVAITAAANTWGSSGWYRVSFFAHALHGYADLPIVVDVLDAGGARLAPPFSIPLRAARGEWLHYDEYVPCNPSGTTTPRLTVSSSGSTIQLTGLSITWHDFASRGLTDVSWSVSAAQAACPVASDGAVVECPTDFGSVPPALSRNAFDNDLETNWLIAAEVPPGSGEYPTMALELEFSTTALVCGVRIRFDDTAYPRSWRVLAKEGDGSSPAAWSTWLDARHSWPSGVGGSVAAGVPPLEVAGGSLHQFGVSCTQAHRLRLEMEGSAGGLFYKTYEIELLTPGNSESSCACRHGGLCVDGGTRCECPHGLGCTTAACGWAGQTCELAACVDSISCENLGYCAGSNTCRCQPGFYGRTGVSQCTETRCGDRVTTSGEECDDGNVVGNDGCSATCQLEPLPSGFARTLSQTWMARSVPLDVLSSSGAVTAASLASQLGVEESQIRITSQDGERVYYEIREYETTCNIELCEIDSTEKCAMQQGSPTCICKEGYGGDKCQTRLCSRICAHGGACVAAETCDGCAAGWEGTFCGTVVAQPSKVVAVALSISVCALLCAAVIVVVVRRRWIPIRARGASSLCGSYIGGIAWVLSALATIMAEDLAYDSGQAEPAGLFGAWLPFVAGFGLWLTASVMHLRAMVKIHIFHEVPTAFFPHMCFVGLIPWAGAALFERGLIATIMCVLALLYVVTHLAQVWQLRDDMDVVESSFATILGTCCMLWGRLAVFGTLDPQLALLYPIATSGVVLVHFLAGSGRLLRLALCDHRNVEILKDYHNDYAPVRGTFRESMLSFDTEVRTQRASIPVATRDNSFRARIGRTRFAQAAGEPLRSSGRFLKSKLAPKEGGSFRRAQGSFSNSFQRAKGSAVGVQLSRTSFDRGQFGARKKLGKKTQQRMGRRGGEGYDPEDSGGKTTAADRGAAWRESAASRVEKQRGPAAAGGPKVAFATPQKGAGTQSPERAKDASARGRFAGRDAPKVPATFGGSPGALPGELPPLPACPTASDGLGEYKRKYRSPAAATKPRQSP